MLLRRGMLLFLCLSGLWAQAPTTVQSRKAAAAKGTRKTSPKAPGSKPASTKVSDPKPLEPYTPVPKEDEAKIEPEAQKLMTAVVAKFKSIKSFDVSGTIDSGRQVDEEPRQPLAKGDFKFRLAPGGAYQLEMIDDDNKKLPYKVYSDGVKRWTYVTESNQYAESAAVPTVPVSAAEPTAAGPLQGPETLVERLARQLFPLLANVDKTTDAAFLRGGVLTLLSKPDAKGHTFLLYLRTKPDGSVTEASWYQSSGEGTVRMMLRTDYRFHTFNELDPAPKASEFQFQPPAGATLAQASAATVKAERN